MYFVRQRPYALDVEVRFSIALHLQTGGQIKRANQCFEAYLRALIFEDPEQWMKFLPFTESDTFSSTVWIQTSTKLGNSIYPVLYHQNPNSLSFFLGFQLTIFDREQMIQKKSNLQHAQSSIKFFADQKRTERICLLWVIWYIQDSTIPAKCFWTQWIFEIKIKILWNL